MNIGLSAYPNYLTIIKHSIYISSPSRLIKLDSGN